VTAFANHPVARPLVRRMAGLVRRDGGDPAFAMVVDGDGVVRLTGGLVRRVFEVTGAGERLQVEPAPEA
jgi:hypothetical protein